MARRAKEKPQPLQAASVAMVEVFKMVREYLFIHDKPLSDDDMEQLQMLIAHYSNQYHTMLDYYTRFARQRQREQHNTPSP